MSSSKEHKLPVRGPKICFESLVNTELDIKKLNDTANTKIDQHKALLTISSPRNTRSKAEWDSEKRLVIVTKRVGKMFHYFGIQTKDNYLLLPEEALFLLEMNYLELQWNSVPLSIQQAYAILLSENNTYCKLKHYRIYTQLLRDNYRMIRHQSVATKEILEIESKNNTDCDVEPSPKRLKSTEEKIDEKVIKPLIDDSVTDINIAMKRLNIFSKNIQSSENELTFIYDGYNPKREFKKTCLSNPDISVSYARAEDAVPTIVHNSNSDSRKLVFGLEGAKNVIFYSIQHINVENIMNT